MKKSFLMSLLETLFNHMKFETILSVFITIIILLVLFCGFRLAETRNINYMIVVILLSFLTILGLKLIIQYEFTKRNKSLLEKIEEVVNSKSQQDMQ